MPRKFGLDEGTIETEAFRSRAEDSRDSTGCWRWRRSAATKALRCIADYRQSLVKQVKQSTDRILDGDEVPHFVAVRKRSD